MAQVNACLRNLRQTDPRVDKDRIVHQKDLMGTSDWVLESAEFCNWYDGTDTPLLWINGGPGMGKTMMVISLIDELSRRLQTNPGSGILSYFFCQTTDLRLNNAISVLRGLIYMLVTEHDTLAKPLKDEFERAGPKLFEDPHAFFALRKILLAMLEIPNHGTIYLVVDALDECTSGLHELLDLITYNRFAPSARVKWLVTSRNQEEIGRGLMFRDPCLVVSLELITSRVSHAVDHFVNIKVQELARNHNYSPELKRKVSTYLEENAEGTFLWVALACQMLQTLPSRKVELALEKLPRGLYPIYERMMRQILNLEDSEDVMMCKCIIISAILARRPLHLKELAATANLPKVLWEDPSSLEELVLLCGSFLTISKDTVYLVHQSAKDFFTEGDGSSIISSHQDEHGKIAYRSLDLMSHTLRENVCDLQEPGTFAAEARKEFDRSRFTHIGYACCYWVDHLTDHLNVHLTGDKHNQLSLFDYGGTVKVFLQDHLLHWLEVLSVLGKVSEGVLMFKRLQSLIHVSFLIG